MSEAAEAMEQPPATPTTALTVAGRCWESLVMVALAYVRLMSRNIAMLQKRDRLMPKASKLQEPTAAQERCTHLNTIGGGNGAGKWTKCRVCGLRLSYTSTMGEKTRDMPKKTSRATRPPPESQQENSSSSSNQLVETVGALSQALIQLATSQQQMAAAQEATREQMPSGLLEMSVSLNRVASSRAKSPAKGTPQRTVRFTLSPRAGKGAGSATPIPIPEEDTPVLDMEMDHVSENSWEVIPGMDQL